MLSMKALKVMIATMGSALLLGSGMAMAVDVGNPEDEPYLVAVESLGMATSTRASAPVPVPDHRPDKHIAVTLPAGAKISATSNARLFGGQNWYVRLDLRNMVFAHGSASIVFTDSQHNGTHEIATVAAGQSGDNEFVVIQLDTTVGEYPFGTEFSFDVSGERLAVVQEVGDTEESMSSKPYEAETIALRRLLRSDRHRRPKRLRTRNLRRQGGGHRHRTGSRCRNK